MSVLGIILLVVLGALVLFELTSLILTIIKKKKLKKEKALQKIEVNNVKQEDSLESTNSQESTSL